MKISMVVNDAPRDVEAPVNTLLVDVLRGKLGLTGTHVGCDTSQCGACTVHVDGQAVKSCTLFAVQAEGHDVKTIEGMAAQDGTLHPIQQAFWDNHGLQCGYCTPGFLMLAVGVLEQDPDIGDAELREVLSSNLCRCTGYQNILKSVKAAQAEIGKWPKSADR